MRTPWFMHCHNNRNTLVGVYPTPYGVYVRSHREGVTEVMFYPMGYGFPHGMARVVAKIGQFPRDSEDQIAAAVEAHLARCAEPAGETV